MGFSGGTKARSFLRVYEDGASMRHLEVDGGAHGQIVLPLKSRYAESKSTGSLLRRVALFLARQ